MAGHCLHAQTPGQRALHMSPCLLISLTVSMQTTLVESSSKTVAIGRRLDFVFVEGVTVSGDHTAKCDGESNGSSMMAAGDMCVCSTKIYQTQTSLHVSTQCLAY